MASASKREAQSAVKHGSEALKDLPADAMDAVKQRVKEVRDETLELVQAGREQVGEYGEQVGETIRSSPVRSVLVALGIGCLIGFLTGRR